MTDFVINDSGERQEYASGMRRDTQQGKIDYTLIPMELEDRLARHLTLGADKYGRENWRLACSEQELIRFKSSARRHLQDWRRGLRDEDHASAVVFNIFAAEYVQAVLDEEPWALAVLEDARRRGA